VPLPSVPQPKASRPRAQQLPDLAPPEASPLMAGLAIVALIAALLVPLYFLLRTQKAEKSKQTASEASEQARLDAAAAKRQAKLEKGGGKKKKGALARMKKGGAAADDDDDDDDEPTARPAGQESEAARAQREAIKEQEASKEEKRRAREAEREAKEKAREEKERLEREAAEKKKQEENDQWANMFSVEETGEDASATAEDEGKLGRFVGQLKDDKVSVLEEVAGEFGMKVHDVLDRLSALELMGHVTGVVDERGKFIFVTPEEMRAVAKYVNKKGRVRISTLAQESNRLIDLTPKVRAEEPDDEAAAPAA